MEKNKTQNKIWIYFTESIKSADAEMLRRYGMQLALSYKMGISFVAFCAFSEIYVRQKIVTNNNSDNPFGMVEEFKERFSSETSISILYRHIAALKTKRLIIQRNKGIYRIPDKVMKNFEKYNQVFYDNVEWQKQTAEIIDENLFKNSKILKLADGRNIE